MQDRTTRIVNCKGRCIMAHYGDHLRSCNQCTQLRSCSTSGMMLLNDNGQERLSLSFDTFLVQALPALNLLPSISCPQSLCSVNGRHVLLVYSKESCHSLVKASVLQGVTDIKVGDACLSHTMSYLLCELHIPARQLQPQVLHVVSQVRRCGALRRDLGR